jgi:hypothetical protein
MTTTITRETADQHKGEQVHVTAASGLEYIGKLTSWGADKVRIVNEDGKTRVLSTQGATVTLYVAPKPVAPKAAPKPKVDVTIVHTGPGTGLIRFNDITEGGAVINISKEGDGTVRIEFPTHPGVFTTGSTLRRAVKAAVRASGVTPATVRTISEIPAAA